MQNSSLEKIMAFWLVPSKDDQKYLQKMIDDFANKLNSVKFEPHLTLYATKDYNLSKAKEVLSDIQQKMTSFHAKVLEIDYTDVYTKALFLSIEINNELDFLYNLIDSNFNSNISSFQPHVSLSYSTIDFDSKQKLISSTDFTFKKIHFNTVKLIDVDLWDGENFDIESISIKDEMILKKV